MALTTILEEQTIAESEFVYNETFGMYVAYIDPAPFQLVVGNSYQVTWDGTTYTCVAVDGSVIAEGAVFIGDATMAGLTGNGEPFIIGGQSTSPTNIMSLTDTESTSHTVAIYLVETETEAPPSAIVKVKGYSGTEFTFEDVPKVWLAAPESTEDNPVLVPFTYGEAVENMEVTPDFSDGDQTITMPDGYLARSAVLKKPEELLPENVKSGVTIAGVSGEYEGEKAEGVETTVELDFSGGDMAVSPEDGQVFSKVNIPVPENLTPENIAEGVDIAGIIGTLASGGVETVSTSGTVTGTSAKQTIEHNLGVIPYVFLIKSTANALTAKSINAFNVISSTVKGLCGFDKYGWGVGYNTGWQALQQNVAAEDNGTTIATNMNESTIDIGINAGYVLQSGTKYVWFAIGVFA